MRKLLVIYSCAALLAVVAGLVGLLVAAVDAGRGGSRAAGEQDWSLDLVAVRGEQDYQRAAEGFRARYPWLIPEEPVEDTSAEDAAAAAAAAAANAPPPPPAWRFVGVLLEETETARFALVAEAGRVSKYKVGEAFQDGTQLLAVGEQSVRVASDGQERDVHLYRPQ